MPAYPVPDLPLLRKVIDHIKAHPEKWNQGTWILKDSCGTIACVGGWAVLFSDEAQRAAYGYCYLKGSGLLIRISEAAQQLLGLTTREAFSLFRGGNNMEDIEEVCVQIAARAGEVW